MKPLNNLIKPNTGKVLLRMLRESSEYVPGISRLNPQSEPYMVVEAVGPTSALYASDIQLGSSPEPFCKPGDYVITRDMQHTVFKLFDQEYSLVFTSDIEAVISEEIVKEIKKQLTSQPKEPVN